MTVRLIPALALACFASGAMAQVRDLAAVRPAVVRLLYRGGGEASGCSGVVAQTGEVLTAAHCLGPDARGRPRVMLEEGEATPTGAERHPQAMDASGTDLARLTLPVEVGGLPFGAPPEPGETLLLMGYRNDMAGVRSELYCPVLGRNDGLVLLGCSVQNGLSGAPLIREGPYGPEVVALVVARFGPAALAAILDDWARGERAPMPRK